MSEPAHPDIQFPRAYKAWKLLVRAANDRRDPRAEQFMNILVEMNNLFPSSPDKYGKPPENPKPSPMPVVELDPIAEAASQYTGPRLQPRPGTRSHPSPPFIPATTVYDKYGSSTNAAPAPKGELAAGLDALLATRLKGP